MNALEKYAAKKKLAMGLMNSLGGLMGRLGGGAPRNIGYDDDMRMLCKVLDRTAAQALALKKKVAMGHKLPSWAEYKVYKAGDAIKSAMASTFSMSQHAPRVSIMIKQADALQDKVNYHAAKIQAKGLPQPGPTKLTGALIPEQTDSSGNRTYGQSRAVGQATMTPADRKLTAAWTGPLAPPKVQKNPTRKRRRLRIHTIGSSRGVVASNNPTSTPFKPT